MLLVARSTATTDTQAQTVGEGEVWILTGGGTQPHGVVKGRWKKENFPGRTIYTDVAGNPIVRVPVTLVAQGATLTATPATAGFGQAQLTTDGQKIVPAEKFPLPSRWTMAPAVFASLPYDTLRDLSATEPSPSHWFSPPRP